MTRNNQKKEVVKLHLTGEYTNRELAKRFKVTEQSICNWLKASQLVTYHRIRKKLETDLEKLVSLNTYKQNAIQISNLITDIERVSDLIDKAKH